MLRKSRGASTPFRRFGLALLLALLLVLNREIALSRTGGDEELLGVILQVLLDNETVWWSQLDAALEQGDLPTVQRLAHTLKGAADNIGAQLAYEAAGHLESLAQSSR